VTVNGCVTSSPRLPPLRDGGRRRLCSPRLAALLDQLANRAVRHPASRRHVTPASLRPALDTGRTADALLDALRGIAGIAVLPDQLTDLVRGAADAHGRVRITTPASLLHSTDTALIAEIEASGQLAPLGLRVVAPTVLTSPLSGDTVLTALRDAGYAPVRPRKSTISINYEYKNAMLRA
jgi:hypothetical protein